MLDREGEHLDGPAEAGGELLILGHEAVLSCRFREKLTVFEYTISTTWRPVKMHSGSISVIMGSI